MRIELRGRNTAVNDRIRDHVNRRFERVSKQLPTLAQLVVELLEEQNPAIADGKVAEATLYSKGVTFRAREASPDMLHSIDLIAEKIARQVKRHRDKIRRRRTQGGRQAAA